MNPAGKASSARSREVTGGAPSGDVKVDDLDRVYVSEGDVIAGKYRVDRLLGIGGVGFVVAAKHLELDGAFALKFLKRRFLRDAAVVERFTREAKAACRIRSDYVARVYDVGSSDGVPFLVMDHLLGRDMAVVLAESGRLGIDEAVEYTIQACAALTVAHAHGIIHRDIKPENLFLIEHEGHRSIKLLDFGISKVALAGDGSKIDAARLTGPLILGSPFYMSPEQIRSTASVDAASDLWSLGVLLYEMLAGTPPFPGDSIADVCAAILQRDPRQLAELRPEVPEGLADVVAHCLQKDAVNRFRTAAELAVALLPFAPLRAIAVAESSSTIARAAIHMLGGASTRTTSGHPSMAALRTSASFSLASAQPAWSSGPALRVSMPGGPPVGEREQRVRVGLLAAVAAAVVVAIAGGVAIGRAGGHERESPRAPVSGDAKPRQDPTPARAELAAPSPALDDRVDLAIPAAKSAAAPLSRPTGPSHSPANALRAISSRLAPSAKPSDSAAILPAPSVTPSTSAARRPDLGY